MPIAITDDHRELGTVARSFLEGSDVLKQARALLDAPAEDMPAFWKEVADLGWLGLHVPEAYGGSGFGLPELVVVVEELGRVVAPGPFLGTAWAAGIIAASGSEKLKKELLPKLVDGSLTAAVGDGRGLKKTEKGLSGEVAVLGGGLAELVLVVLDKDVVIVEPGQKGARLEVPNSLDPTRRVATLTLKNPAVPAGWTIKRAAPRAVALGRTLAAAEASGGARACVEMATEYVKVRKQFNRIIGTFQAVKHHAADMLVASELATAVAWDAARAEADDDQFELAAAIAGARAIPAFFECAKLNIQLHGGIGYTWEHDAHVYLRRAATLVAVFGPVADLQRDVVKELQSGTVREFAVNLPPEAEAFRKEVRAFVKSLAKLKDDKARTKALLDNGYVMPHWPKPWGRAAGAVEQLVIDEELRGVPRPQYGIGGWVIQTLTQHANDDQIQRWIRPSLEGEYYWCQLFSEPDAGSDAAGIRTKATRVDGGWLINGQKIWTSGAQMSSLGLATVRTDPDAPKHEGITAVVINLKDPAVEVRPLREASGGAMFCEVFFNDYFAPDDDVVGQVNGGWKVARATLGNERVSIGRGGVGSSPIGNLLDIVKAHKGDSAVAAEVGAILAEEQAMSLLNLRSAERSIAGAEPGPEGNVSKLLSGEHAQRVADFGLAIGGPSATRMPGGGEAFFMGGGSVASAVIFTRCLTIAGGTSEIVRSQIGERILGLPRDPLVD